MMTKDKSKNTQKKVKSKGPIRWEAIGPLAIILVIIVTYFGLFFDSHLRRALAWGLSLANGAEANVASVKINWKDAQITLAHLQLTDPAMPTNNRLEIDKLNFQLMWDGILRGKAVIKDASIENIQVASPRKKAGWVAPPPPPEKDSQKNTMADKLLTSAGEKFSENILGDIAKVLQGVDPGTQLKTIESELKSKKHIEAVQAEFNSKQSDWQKQFKDLPQAKDFTALQKKLNSIQSSNFKTPQELQNSLEQFQAVMKEAEQMVQQIDQTSRQMNQDLNKLQADFQRTEKLVQEDIRDLQTRLKIPNLDLGSLSKSFFGQSIMGYLQKGEKYIRLAQSYMPPKKAKDKAKKENPPLTPHQRARGVNYAFGRPNSYPLFWLKRAAISSKAAFSPFAGDLSGSMTNLSTDPALIANPFEIKVEGNFPQKNLQDLKIHAQLDHRTDKPVESFEMLIGRYDVDEKKFSESPEVNFGIAKAQGRLNLKASYADQKLDLKSHSQFSQIEYQIQASQPDVKDILQAVTNDIKVVNVDANVHGPLDTLKFAIQSNLGAAIEQGFRKQIQLRLEAAQKQIREYVEQRIAQEKQKIQAELNAAQAQVNAAVKEAQTQANRVQAQAQSEAQKAESKAKDQARHNLEKAGKKALEDLKNKFKF